MEVSTTLEMGRIARGDEAPLDVPGRRTHRRRPRRSGPRSACTARDPRRSPRRWSAVRSPASATARSGQRRRAPVAAATSRASPRMLRASPRFGLTSMSSTTSPARSARPRPMAVSGGRMRMPSASPVSPSSSPLQSIPWLSTPAMRVTSMRRSPGSTEPGRATGTRWPTAMFVAPQTMESSGSPGPTRTRVSESRPARGCGADLEELADDDALPLGADALDAADLHAQERQPLRERLGRAIEVHVLGAARRAGRASRAAPGSAGRWPGRRGCR